MSMKCNNIKIFSAILFLMMFLLVSCGKNNGAENGSTKLNKEAKLVMCTNAEYPPYEYYDGGKMVGIDVEISERISEKLGLEIEIVDVAFDALIPMLTSGKADFALAGMAATEDRGKFVDFSHPYQTTQLKVIVPVSSDIKTTDDLQGKKIGVQTGTTEDLYCTSDFGEEAVERYPKIIDGFQTMKLGKIDAIIVNYQVGKNIVEQDSNTFRFLDTDYAAEELSIAVKKGNADLLDRINVVIDEMKANGELQAIIDSYTQTNKDSVIEFKDGFSIKYSEMYSRSS